MGPVMLWTLRVVLALLLLGSVFVQAVMVPMLGTDLRGADEDVARLRVPLLVIVVLGIGTAQVTLVCVWRLVAMVRRGTVFSAAAFRYVDVIAGAFAAASTLVFVLGALLAPGTPVAPGVVLLLGGLGLAVAGVALVVVVLRMLLAQAVARDGEARQLQAELDGVI